MEKKYPIQDMILPADKVAFIQDAIDKLKASNRSDYESGDFDISNHKQEARYKTFEEVLQWLNSKTTGPRWARATEFEIKYGPSYYAKWLDGKIKATGWFQQDGTFFWNVPGYIPIGKDEYEHLSILDENADVSRYESMKKEVIDFIRDIAKNYDCDRDAHKYNTICRKCSASELLYDLTREQKEARP